MKNLPWALEILKDFTDKKSYGELTFTVQAGEIINIKTITSQKPVVDNKTQGQ